MTRFSTLSAMALALPALALSSVAYAQNSDPLFTESGVFGAAWGTKGDAVEPILLQNPDIMKVPLRELSESETADQIQSYDWTTGGYTYAMDSFTGKGTDQFLSVEIVQVDNAACDALENYFVARLGAGTAKTKEMTDKADNSTYTARTRVWVGGEVKGNLYGYAYLPANGDGMPYCMMTVITADAY